MTKFAKILGCAALLAFAGHASAKTVTLSLTLDLSTSADGGGLTTTRASLLDPVDLAEGDVLDMTFDFAGGQSLTLDNPDLLWTGLFVANDQPEANVTMTGHLEFGGLTGPGLSPSADVTLTSGAVHVGNYFYAGDYTSGPGPISFTSVRQVLTIESYNDPSITSRAYGEGFLSVTAAPVPEAGEWAMMAAGLGIVGGAARRRRAKAA